VPRDDARENGAGPGGARRDDALAGGPDRDARAGSASCGSAARDRGLGGVTTPWLAARIRAARRVVERAVARRLPTVRGSASRDAKAGCPDPAPLALS
jgi:hypothetical protein